MRILLTGFGPFGSVQSNPTERLLPCFERKGRLVSVTTQVLPVSFLRAPLLLRERLERGTNGQPFDALLMLGVAAGSSAWRVEAFGRNADAALQDADGFTPPARIIDPALPETLSVTLPVEELRSAIERTGVPVVRSETAGAYLCNHALFHALRRVQQQKALTRVGFLHVPADEHTAGQATDWPVFPFALHVETVRAALDAVRNASPNAA